MSRCRTGRRLQLHVRYSRMYVLPLSVSTVFSMSVFNIVLGLCKSLNINFLRYPFDISMFTCTYGKVYKSFLHNNNMDEK